MLTLTRRGLLATSALAATGLVPARAAAPSATITIAEIFEPPGLDPTVNSVDLVSTITENVFDTLYAFDKDWKPAPLLAAEPAEVSEGGSAVSIKLRAGVTFHDGSAMTAADVAASLRRWLKLSSRGQLAAPLVTEIAEPAPDRVVIKLKQAFPPLLSLLAFNSATAIILPKAKAEAAMAGPLTRIEDLIGTGPFKLAERRPDQYIRLVRFQGYTPSPLSPSGYAGARKPGSDVLTFVPVPNVNTRLQGLLNGQYDIADGLSTDNYAQIEQASGLVPVITKPGGWLLMVMNTKQGLTANPLIRQAAQAALDNEAIMTAALGSPKFFELGSSLYPNWSPYRSDAGAKLYNQKDPAKAKTLLAQAGYKGETFRILTSQQYDYVYKAALVAMQNLQDAGFNVDLQLMDWASVMSRRFDPAIWESFITFHGFVPDPALITILSPGYPGWWDTPAKRTALETFNTATDDGSRSAAWGKLQDLLMQEAPTVQLGKYFGLLAHQRSVHGVPDLPITPFWAATKG
ncbi:MAG: ABC transporter substrate-binding protein [Acetobacteraceae bacterium]|nr:ABC transporter substrate-binding protein [Acetobacteraceae bacterium]